MNMWTWFRKLREGTTTAHENEPDTRTIDEVIPSLGDWQKGDEIRHYRPGWYGGPGISSPPQITLGTFEGLTEDGLVVRIDGHLHEWTTPGMWERVTNPSWRDRELEKKISATSPT